MRTRIICILNLMIMSSSVVVFAGDFEGVIHMKTTFGGSAEGRTGDSDWYIKGDNIRTERRAKSTDTASAGSRGGMIFNAGTKDVYGAVRASFEKAGEHLRDMKYEIVRTGKTDTVAGYQCEMFQTKSKETGKIQSEACAAKGLAN